MKILHVGKKLHSSNQGKYSSSYYEVLIVLQTENSEEETWLEHEQQEYKPILAIDDIDAYKTALANNDFIELRKHVKRSYITQETFIEKAKRNNVYIVREYFADCPTVNAILGELAYIRDGGELKTLRHTQYCHIISLLKALDGFWD